MRRLIYSFAVLALAILVSSCVEDDLAGLQPNEKKAELRLSLPSSSLIDVGATTRTANSELEKKIARMDVFLFEVKAEGEEAPADDAVVVAHYDEFVNNDGVISMSLLERDEPCWVVAVANRSKGNLSIHTFEDLKNLSLNLTSLYATSNASKTQTADYAYELPMYAQQYFTKIANGVSTLALEHIFARIDVKMAEGLTGYKLESVTLMNGANTGHYVPQSPMTAYQGAEEVTQYGTTKLEEGRIPSIYLYENAAETGEAKNYTDLILGGKYAISPSDSIVSYLKVKLAHGEPEKADIERNTCYNVTLQSISASNIGYTTLEDAQKGEYADAKIDITVDEDAMSDVVIGNGDYYMSFSNSEYRAYIPSGEKKDLTAFTLRFDKNSSSLVDIAKVKKEISLGSGSAGFSVVGGTGNKSTVWAAATDIDVQVHFTSDEVDGSIIVRIGNLVKEIKIVREKNAANLPTAFTDADYVSAKFVHAAPSWLKIATSAGVPEVKDELHSDDGFTLAFEKDISAPQSAELYLFRSSAKGHTKVYVEQYTLQPGSSIFKVSGMANYNNIDFLGKVLSDKFTISDCSGTYDFLDETQHSGDAPWEVEFSHDNGETWTTTKPDWIDMPTRGNGPLPASTVTVAPQDVVGMTGAPIMEKALKAAAAKGSSSAPYNLANNSDANNDNESTANCYMVGAPGTYKLPLVYGNARKNGSANEVAYTGDNFVKHDDLQITKPEIDGAANAILMWQDAPDLVTDVQLSGSDYLVFTVPQETIKEGNAVLAVRDASNTVLWSWHIWVTTYTDNSYKEVFYKTGTTQGSSNMMTVNLGWCSQTIKQYGEDKRQVNIRLKPAGGDYYPQIPSIGNRYTWVQFTGNASTLGSNTYYQFGRKDPMLPADDMGNYEDKEQFGNLLWGAASEQVTVGEAIQNPNLMYVGSYNWCKQVLYNLWSAKNTSLNIVHIEDHVKTVYDPSPAGWVIPPVSYYTGFSTSGNDTSTKTGINTNGIWNNGYNFYCELNKKGTETIYFPSTAGRVDSNPNRIEFHGYSYIWSASTGYSYAYPFNYNEQSVRLFQYFNRSYGYSVRPVRE